MRSSDAGPEPIGQTIAGRYRILRKVGEGGSGNVYAAEQILGASQRTVAVKLLRPERSRDPAVKARFHREAATVARLEHFNTVRIYDFGEAEDGTLFIVMEYLEGHTLSDLLAASGALPASRVLHLATQIAASLEEAHGLGIVHRDLKPDNIVLLESYASQRDVVKLVDFGIAKGEAARGSATTKLTELGSFVGTPAYMSPEQFTSAPVSARSDIYSLGVTTYQMLAGRLPFDADTVVAWARAHLNEAPAKLEADHGAGAIPEHMRRAVMRALAKDPGERQISARQFSLELSGRGATAATQAALEAPPRAAPAANADAPPSNAAAGEALVAGDAKPMHTAPMTRLPEVGGRNVGPTQPMAAAHGARAGVAPTLGAALPFPAAQPYAGQPYAGQGEPMRKPKRRLLWVAVALALASGALFVLLLLNVKDVRIGSYRFGQGPESEPLEAPLFPSPAPEPSPPSTSPTPTEPTAPELPEIPPPRERPPAAAPAPTPAPSSPAAPTPSTPALPPLLPPAPGAPAPAPAPGTPQLPPALPVPPLPWNLPTAGSCQRCVEALRGSGNYVVVTAVAESLLCEDRNLREQCEREIESVAPAVAERAARAGDCPAALATAAAAVNVRVPADRFRTVEALCLR